ncbi:MAG: hypothetical protein RLZZ15_3571 [Verrucomicrobiota bacterium]|jgi:putative endonuclease
MFARLRQLLGLAPASAGARGEKLAAAWLRRERGFTIVARNWRRPRDRRDELDLVCRDGETLVFVEVKTRAADALVPGLYAVDARKKRVLLRTAAAYLAGLRVKPRTFRLDVVEVVFPTSPRTATETSGAGGAVRAIGEPQIVHFENVALFPKNFRG